MIRDFVEVRLFVRRCWCRHMEILVWLSRLALQILSAFYFHCALPTVYRAVVFEKTLKQYAIKSIAIRARLEPWNLFATLLESGFGASVPVCWCKCQNIIDAQMRLCYLWFVYQRCATKPSWVMYHNFEHTPTRVFPWVFPLHFSLKRSHFLAGYFQVDRTHHKNIRPHLVKFSQPVDCIYEDGQNIFQQRWGYWILTLCFILWEREVVYTSPGVILWCYAFCNAHQWRYSSILDNTTPAIAVLSPALIEQQGYRHDNSCKGQFGQDLSLYIC